MFLYHHDASASSSAAAMRRRGGERSSEAVDPGASSRAVQQDTAKAAVSPATSSASVDQRFVSPAPVEFKLKRSRTYQRIGTIGLRLVRVNTRRRTCDLSVQLSDRRVVQKRLVLNKPLQLKPPTSTDLYSYRSRESAGIRWLAHCPLWASSSDATKQASIQ